MNIIYVGAFRFPYFDAAAARVLNIGKSFRMLGHSVEFIAMGGKEIESHKLPNGVFEYQGFPYKVTNELDSTGRFMSKIQLKLTRGNKIIQELDSRNLANSLVIAYNPTGNFFKRIISISHKKNFKLAVDLTEWYDRNELPITDWVSYFFCMNRTMCQIKNKILISSFFDKYYHSNNIVIPATCDCSDKKWHRITDKIMPFDGITLIYAGNPAKKDKVHTVINAVNYLVKDGLKFRFLIIGIDKKQYLSKYGDLLTEKELSNNIVFLGRVNQEDVPSYYKAADFMILVREDNRKSNAGFPTKFAESYSAGVPVIANATSDIKKYLRNRINGILLKSDTYTDILDSLRFIYNELTPEEISAMKREAMITGKSSFDYQNYVSELKLFIDALH